MDEIQLRNLYGPATEKASAKIMKTLDPHSVSFINASNFLVMGTFDGEDIDLSPKGDPKGFVKVISDDRIEIADRPGNNRIDGLLNISRNAIVSLIFFIPKVTETLRVQGKATISNDPKVLENHKLKSNLPARAFSAKFFISRAISQIDFLSTSFITGTTKPSLVSTEIPML